MSEKPDKLKIETHNYRDGNQALLLCGKPVLAFVGMIVGASETNEDIFELATHWKKFLHEHGWKERKPPLQTSVFVEDQFVTYKRACVSLSLVHGDQVGHVLLAFQGLFAHKEIDAGVLCVSGKETFNRVKADLSWLQGIVTVPIWVVAVIPFDSRFLKKPLVISSHLMTQH
jgi:hypothetical protein